MLIEVEQVRVPARDGYPLAGTHIMPEGQARAAVVLASATGVPRRFYERFARYLGEAGLAALTLDYRGIGDSAPERLRGFSATLYTWGEQDLGGGLDWLAARYPGRPLLLVGHSVGGQIAGFAPGAERIAGALMVACQSGYWGLWPTLRGKAAMWFLWHALIPGFTWALGYLPMRAFRQGEDLPRDVALEWARWGRHPDYLGSLIKAQGLTGHARFRAPIRSLCIADDTYAPRPTVERLLTLYSSAPSELAVIHPHEVGAKSIGHFGFFRDRFRDNLWRDARAWLERFTTGPA
jgi:predicted alpha/beta hydrolase